MEKSSFNLIGAFRNYISDNGLINKTLPACVRRCSGSMMQMISHGLPACIRALSLLLLLLVVMTALAGTAHADVLVSNVGKATDGSRSLNGTDRAQAFDAGDHAGGYNLESIGLHLGTIATSATGVLTVTVRGDSSGSPSNTVLYTLTNPSFGAVGLHEFTAPANAALDANATYHVVASFSETSGSFHISRVLHNSGVGFEAPPPAGISTPLIDKEVLTLNPVPPGQLDRLIAL